MPRFYAYRHLTGSIIVKKYTSVFNYEESRQSMFVMRLCKPFWALNAKHAEWVARRRLKSDTTGKDSDQCPSNTGGEI